MAKSARASSRKSNNRRLAAKVFGPVEAARAERLSAKLLEAAQQPKPSAEVNMEAAEDDEEAQEGAKDEKAGDEVSMEVDSKSTKTRSGEHRISKRRVKKSKMVFTKFSDRRAAKKKGTVAK